MDTFSYDVIVIGAGPAGENVAAREAMTGDAVPAYPTVSEVWPRLLEAYGR